ncbi:hypothetical protein [Microbulbifer sp. TRSA007]|uniref:hypothetical protein n=1 Tax=Microbulbifer sp. TRSA007 TaxID=3243384 RepID=UPI0040392159
MDKMKQLLTLLLLSYSLTAIGTEISQERKLELINSIEKKIASNYVLQENLEAIHSSLDKIAIPIAKAVNPITKANWEGTGVKPDIEISREKAFPTAYRLPLQEAKISTAHPEHLKEIQQKLQDFVSL